jgi:hypothetical protein
MNTLLKAASMLNQMDAKSAALSVLAKQYKAAQEAFNQQEKEFFAFIETKEPERAITELGGNDAAEQALANLGYDTEVLNYINP